MSATPGSNFVDKYPTRVALRRSERSVFSPLCCFAGLEEPVGDREWQMTASVVENSSIYALKRTIAFPEAHLDTITVLDGPGSFRALYRLGR